MTIRKLPTNEKFSPQVKIEGTKNVVTFAVRKSDKDDDKFALTCALDFTNVKSEDLIQLATRAVVIDLQRKWRVAHVGDKVVPTTNEFATVDVAAMLNEPSKKTPASPVKAARKAFESMSPADIAALLAEYANKK